MPIDWSKYKTEEKKPTEKTSNSSVDWSKYGGSSSAGVNPTRTEIQSAKPLIPFMFPSQSPILQDARAWEAAGKPGMIQTPEELPGRGIPVIGPVLKGLDFVAEKTDPFADFARSFYTPGAGLGNVTGAYNAVGAGINKVAPKLGNTLKGRVVQEAIKEGVTGVPLSAGQTLASGETDLREVAKQGLLGGALGAAGGGLIGAARPLISRGIQRGKDKLEFKGAVNDFIKRTEQPTTVKTPKPSSKPYRSPETDTKSQLVTKLDKEPFSAPETANKFYTNFIDDLHRMNQFDKYVEKTLGNLKPSERAYDLALTSRGSDIISNQILTENLVDVTGNVTGNSLKQVLSRIPKGSYVDFEDYLTNRHALTRSQRGEKVFDDKLKWTPAQGAQKIAEYEATYPQFRKAADDYYNFNNNMVKNWLVDTGLITRQQAAKWVAENPFYVPMKRQFSELEKAGVQRVKRGFSGQKAPVKKYSETGSQRKIVSPIESTIENVDAFVKAAKRNQVMQSMVRNIRKSPESFEDWVEIVPIREEATGSTIKDINKVMSEEGVEGLVERLNDDFETTFRRVPNQGLDKDNIVTAIVDGQPVHLKINDRPLLDALESLGPEGQNWILDNLGKVTRIFKVLTTGANPIFGLVRNLPRDVAQAFIARKNSNIGQFAGDLVDSFVSSLGNRKLYQSYKNIGGGHSSPVASDRNLLAQSKRSILPQNPIKSAIPKSFGALENFMNSLESIPRLGEFKRAGMGSEEELLKGLRDAQDITVNFKRHGKLARQVDKVFPYFNAAMQGLDKIVRMYKDNPVKAMARTMTSITVPTIALYALNYDNPEYQKVSKHVRDNFYLIPDGNGKFIRVAKPRELGIPFSAAIERQLDSWLKNDPNAFADFSNAIRVAFAPPGISGALSSGSITDRILGAGSDTILGPTVDLARNRNFADVPIVPGSLENLSPELQYDDRTSEVSKAISRLTKKFSDKTGIDITTSPKQLDHLIRSYTGVLGQFGLPATTQGATIGETLQRQVVTDPVYSNDTQNRFYDIKEKLDQAQADFRATGEESKNFNDDLRTVYNQVNQIMGEFRAASREIENSNISDEKKKQYTREIRKRINELAEKTNEVYRKYQNQ